MAAHPAWVWPGGSFRIEGKDFCYRNEKAPTPPNRQSLAGHGCTKLMQFTGLNHFLPPDTMESLHLSRFGGSFMATMEQAAPKVAAGKVAVYKNFIGGEWVETHTGRSFENLNPADTRDVVGVFQRSDAEDVNCAIDAASEGRRLFGPTVPSELPNKFAMAVRQPLGVCAMITPWNFPMAIPSWKLFPALVAGNVAVIKPAQDTPLSTFNFVQALTDGGIPAGVVNIVTGFGSEVGTPMTQHAAVRAVSLTGSTAVGRVVGQEAAKTFKHCSLELGGKNPMIVLDDANLLWGAFGTAGQRCTATSRIIVQTGVYKKFVDELVARAQKLKVGNGLDESVDMGPAINKGQMETDLKYIEIGKGEGAKMLCGGHRLEGEAYKYGWFVAPTVFADVDPKMRIAQEEIFGPVVSVIPCDGLKNAIAIANDIEYGLSSSIYTKDVNKAFTAMRDLYAGITYINAPTIGAEVHLPFGGTKATGNGHREGGIGAIDFYTEWKSVYVDYSDKLQKAQIDRPE